MEKLFAKESNLIKDNNFRIGVPYVCHAIDETSSGGVWFGDNPLAYPLPLFLLQLSLITIFTRTIYFLLKPLGQTTIISQILGGLVLGPSILGQSAEFRNRVFPTIGRVILENIAFFGFMVFIFLIGVKIDPCMVLKSGRKTLSIGVLGFLLPYAFAGLVAFLLNSFATLDDELSDILPNVVAIQSMTLFPVIACFLTELNILNSEIGQLASSSSIVSEACHWSIVTVKFAADLTAAKSFGACVGHYLSSALLILFLVFGVHNAALWAIRRTPEGKPIKEIYIFIVLLTLLFCEFTGEAIGLNAFVASFFMGLAIPDGPPLGAALVEKFDCFVSVLFMPIFFTIGGLRMNIFAIKKLKNVGAVQLITFASFLGKMLGTVSPLLFCRMPLRDAMSLGLIMNTKGVVELGMLIAWKVKNVINDECYTLMVLSLMVVTGIVSPIVKALYIPSNRFIAYKRRTFLNHNPYEELRILVCVHRPENVLAILNLLAASNPTKGSPISLVVLHLMKLAGRASSLLIAHLPRERSSQYPTQSERIFNAFTNFELHRRTQVLLHFYKGISPYATMHNDVCYLALEKRTTFIIIPFHKQWTIGGRVESSYAFRQLNKNVLEKAPCSVGILVDRGNQKNFWSIDPTSYKIALAFFGGSDDREALAYAMRMMELPNVYITLILFSSSNDIVGGTTRSKTIDTQVLSEFRLNAFRNDRVRYKDELVEDGGGVLKVLEATGFRHDLVMVGRRHAESQILASLGYWNDDGELGFVGEVLASSNFRCPASVLVVQQQTKIWGVKDPEATEYVRRQNYVV